MLQRGLERGKNVAIGALKLGIELPVTAALTWSGGQVMQDTLPFSISHGAAAELEWMSVIPLFSLAKATLDRKPNALILPGVLAFAGAAVLGHFHQDQLMAPAYVTGLLGVGGLEFAASRRKSAPKAPQG